MVWSPDDIYLAVSTPFQVFLFSVQPVQTDMPSVELPPTALSFWEAIGSVAFSSDMSVVSTLDPKSGNLLVWSLMGQPIRTVTISATDYTGVAAIAPDLSIWATAHWDGTIRLWDGTTGALLHELHGHTRVGAMMFSPDGSLFISDGGSPYGIGDNDNTVRLWNVTSGESLAVFTTGSMGVYDSGVPSSIAFDATGSNAYVIGYTGQGNNVYGTIYRLNVTQRSLQPVASNVRARELAVNPVNGVLVISLGSSASLLIGDHLQPLSVTIDDWEWISAVAVSPNGTVLALVYEGLNGNSRIELCTLE